MSLLANKTQFFVLLCFILEHIQQNLGFPSSSELRDHSGWCSGDPEVSGIEPGFQLAMDMLGVANLSPAMQIKSEVCQCTIVRSHCEVNIEGKAGHRWVMAPKR